ncbi:MAG: dihydropteroate synthase [Polyangiales bacterium]
MGCDSPRARFGACSTSPRFVQRRWPFSSSDPLDLEAAVAHGLALRDAGADVVDVGGESTRPKGATYEDGYSDVSVDEELARVVPVVAGWSLRAWSSRSTP